MTASSWKIAERAVHPACAAVVLGGTAALIPNHGLSAVVVATSVVAVAGLISLRDTRIEVTYVAGACAVCALVDLPGRFKVGPTSAGAWITALLCVSGLAILLTPTGLQTLRLVRSAVWPMGVLLVWSSLSLLWSTDVVAGLQNVLAFGALLAVTFVTASAVRTGAIGAERVNRLLAVAFALAALLYLAGVVHSGLGSDSLVGSRSFALVGFIGVCWACGALREHRIRTSLVGLLCLLCTVASLSRLAVIGSLIVLFFSSADFDRFVTIARSASLVGAVVVVGYIGYAYTNPLKARFTGGDITHVHGLAISANGRGRIWRVVWTSTRSALITGRGAGSADGLVARLFKPAAEHVHDDYLRLLHDYGVPGLALWTLGVVRLFRWAAVRKSRRQTLFTSDESILLVGAQLGILALALAMVTDNPLLYTFVTTPVGILVGAAIGIRHGKLSASAAMSSHPARS
jgi:O-antigen ligase